MLKFILKFLKQNWRLLADRRTPFSAKLSTLNKLIKLKIKNIRKLRVLVKPSPPRFTGWGMTSKWFLPWELGSGDTTGQKFGEANELLLVEIEKNEFILSQFLKNGSYDESPAKILAQLSWRHYIVYWSVKCAAKSSTKSNFNIVEAGVCDGLTINFAIRALEDSQDQLPNFDVFLYDAWEGMKEENLTTIEKRATGEYSYLSLEQTIRNLRHFQEKCKFIQGHIPNVFVQNPGPSELSWLHIDLNSSMPTQRTLEHFVPKLQPGGVVLFDDYAHSIFSETRKVADDYCKQANGLLFPLPTGQAIFFKH